VKKKRKSKKKLSGAQRSLCKVGKRSYSERMWERRKLSLANQ
jgi:hypothetical protein